MSGRPKNHMKTFGFWFYQELLPIMGLGMPRTTLVNARGEEFQVNVESSRLECLKRNPKCVACGAVGVIWMLQSWKDERPHLNLYAVNRINNLILMTQDHIIPKSKGGSSSQNNLQTMCTGCNKQKADTMPIVCKVA